MKKTVFIIILFLAKLSFGQSYVFNFQDLSYSLPDTGFWNGSDLSGKFVTQVADVNATFYNNYNESWGSWSGFAYSSLTNDTTGDYTNQYSTYAGNRLTDSPSDSIFAVGYVPSDYNNDYKPIPIGVKFSDKINIQSAYVANNTYAALTMLNGNSFSDAFADGDFFYLIIRGYNNNEQTGEINYYLADYRDGKQFVQKVWRYVDLSTIGTVDSLTFELASSDVGSYGINTPTYFCLDEIVFTKAGSLANIEQVKSEQKIKIYPNPVEDYGYLSTNVESFVVYDLNGHAVAKGNNTNRVEMKDLPGGIYILKYQRSGTTGTIKILKK